MLEIIQKPWPWYISGPLIALVMFLLLKQGKDFGISNNLRTMCTIVGAGKTSAFFRFDWKSQIWNLLIVLGTIIGGFIAHYYLSDGSAADINPKSISDLQSLGIIDQLRGYMPESIFIFNGSLFQFLILSIGGLLIGFGTRYAGGCSSGHAISGLSNFQLPSLIAVIGFFIGGVIMVHFIFPLIF
ncbi:YeeE/YedE family protein [Sphingobacterium sp. SRCM116780]|uniref:YeeE/YedE family protein n=1 Tax=Sphingobacterium sp. SRCM116780 TaxID=2907623 RepID=UPI001F23658B|nr:YeeE/YedE thiosulfate transporter family protein [Sphingobacterium sp. SRCM116780]UIR55544.1 YeeE/YedE family protein [Sphingobacterium sp. SRCM116780]